jgi:hypothetical protein
MSRMINTNGAGSPDLQRGPKLLEPCQALQVPLTGPHSPPPLPGWSKPPPGPGGYLHAVCGLTLAIVDDLPTFHGLAGEGVGVGVAGLRHRAHRATVDGLVRRHEWSLCDRWAFSAGSAYSKSRTDRRRFDSPPRPLYFTGDLAGVVDSVPFRGAESRAAIHRF